MLRGMGFDNNTSIYLASGKIYHAGRYLAPLLKMFPLIYSKESLATPEELAPFKVSNQILTDKSDVVPLLNYQCADLLFWSIFVICTRITSIMPDGL